MREPLTALSAWTEAEVELSQVSPPALTPKTLLSRPFRARAMSLEASAPTASGSGTAVLCIPDALRGCAFVLSVGEGKRRNTVCPDFASPPRSNDVALSF